MSEITYVNIRKEHAKQLRQLQLICFPTVPPEDLFLEEELTEMVDIFPDGVFVALDGDKVVGLGAGHFTDFDFGDHNHTMMDMIEAGHDPDGDYYYGTDISVHPDYRRRGIGGRLYELRKEVVRKFNRKGIVAGGFIPGFANYKADMDARSYVDKVVAGELYDPTLSMQLRQGFKVRGILSDYMRVGKSDGYATLIVWENPDYHEEEPT